MNKTNQSPVTSQQKIKRLPAHNAKEAVGLYITEEKINLTRLKREASGEIRVLSSLAIPTPKDSIKNGLIINPQGLSQAIKKIYANNAIKKKEITVGISKPEVVTRIVELPQMPPAQTKEALKGEVDKYIVFAGEKTLIDYYRIDKKSVFLIAAKKRIVQSLLATISKARLDLQAIEIIPLSILRLLIFSDKGLYSKKTLMLLLIRPKIIDIHIVKEGIICFSHSLEESTSSDLIHEVKLASTYWDERFPNNSIEKIVVFTDIDKYKDNYEELSVSIGTEVIDGRTKLTSKLEGGSLCSGSAAVGLALRGLVEKTTFDINLIPPERARRKLIKRNILLYFISMLSLVLVLFILNLAFSALVGMRQKELTSIKQKLGSSIDILAQIEKINKNREYLEHSLREKKDFIYQLNIIPWIEVLNDLKDFIPEEVWLQQINATAKDRVILKGKAFSEDTVYKYVNLLEYSEYFNEPKLTLLEGKYEKGRALVSFSITCPLTPLEMR